MQACFVDCTPEMRELFDRGVLDIPDGVNINFGDPSTSDIIQTCQTTQVLMVEHSVISPDVFDKCPNIQAVIFMGTGAGTYIDLADAKARGIEVLTTPGYGNTAVAEHAFALMISAARQVAAMDRDLRKGIWQPLGGMQLTGRKVAVVGLGGIGRAFADFCTGFGMEVFGWNRSEVEHDCYCADLTEVLRDADIVSLHLALSENTNGFLTKNRLSMPREGYILVNTARAQLIDDAALMELLASGKIGHIATDVFTNEPVDSACPLLSCTNTTLTSHAAYMTEGAYVALWNKTLAQYSALTA